MNDEPTHDEVREDDNEPVTKGLLRSEGRSLRTEIEGVDQRLMNVETDVKELKQDTAQLKRDMTATKETVQRVLDVVKTVEENTRGLKDLPSRVAQNEADIFKIQASSH